MESKKPKRFIEMALPLELSYIIFISTKNIVYNALY